MRLHVYSFFKHEASAIKCHKCSTGQDGDICDARRLTDSTLVECPKGQNYCFSLITTGCKTIFCNIIFVINDWYITNCCSVLRSNIYIPKNKHTHQARVRTMYVP